MTGPRSLFVIGLPRSLTTLVYDVARHAIGLKEPTWTSAGEILNGDRMVTSGLSPNGVPKFTPPESVADFDKLGALFDDVVSPYGHAYKDVTQPWVVSSRLVKHSLAVLRVKRPVTQVFHHMERHGWFYPAGQSHHKMPTQRRPAAMLSGLRQAQQVLDDTDAVTVTFEELIFDEQPLRNALQRLYPGQTIPPLNYIDRQFTSKRTAVLNQH